LVATDSVQDRLFAHLRTWLGQWPPAGVLSVVGYPARLQPGWDDGVHDVIGVASPDAAVVSVPPEFAEAARTAANAWAELPKVLPAAVGRPEASAFIGTFRWCSAAADLPDVGSWLPPTDPRLPGWLRPFNGDVLVAFDGDRYAAGVGLKRHDRYGVEVAVGTDPEYRGRGLAVRLCAQAARRIMADGAVATYLHDPDNVASARTGAAAGFVDRGWQVLGMTPLRPSPRNGGTP
jgi:GNAT superfamily N-acetyltransferase